MAPLRAVFVGDNSTGKLNLWVTDGTAVGTSDFTTDASYSELVSANISPDFTLFGHELLFTGRDASGHWNIWVTDGTTAGTSELTPVTGASSYGLLFEPNNPDFTVFGNEVLFAGFDSNDHTGLWVTNGTAAGTSELNAVGAANGGVFESSNSYPPDFTVLGSEVLFVGENATGNLGLWITNGTTAGTSEISVLGTAANFVYTPDLTVLGGEAILEGVDAKGNIGLWKTDGTSFGTSELNVTGAYYDANDVFAYGSTKPDFTLLNGKALFEGYDSSFHLSVWITDGTSAGTSELPVAGGYSGNTIATQGPYFTAFGSEALFLALNASDVPTVGVTNGTGTSALTVGGAYAGGLFDWSTTANPDFTALGSEVLFEGEDSSGHLGLWVTDGTQLGTSELTNINNAYAGGLFASGVNPDITANGNVALFDGYDSSGHLQLWVTNGTAAGTSEVMASGADSTGLNPSDFAFLPITAQKPTSDFNGDGKSDFLWQSTGGQADVWLMNGATPTSEGFAGTNPGASWQVIGAGDFNGDGKADILWQNTNGQAAVWLMNGAAPTSEALVGSNPGASWHVVGSGDFNGDGKADILWQNTDGQAAGWLMNGTTPTSEALVGANPGTSWQVVGAGDFTGNGKSDILWQNTDGQADVWLMNGTTVTSEAPVGTNPGPSWHIVGTGDFTGNGISDILWQNTDGQAAIWLMNGVTPTSEALVGANLGPSWHIVGTGDFNGDGKADILWQNTNGQADVWLMNGATPISESFAGANPGTSWHIHLAS